MTDTSLISSRLNASTTFDWNAYSLRQERRNLKRVVWVYFILLIVEGGIRKWVPGASVPFLLIRDPLALFIWYSGYKQRIGQPTAWAIFHCYAVAVSVLGLLQILVLRLIPTIFVYGWRSYVLHIPVMIVIAALFDMEDISLVVKWTLIVALPMTLLMVLQYDSSPTAFLNKGASEGGRQISGALGHVRPAGLFSFITGPIEFIPLCAAFLIWGIARGRLLPRWLLAAVGVAIIISVPISVSRTVFLMSIAVLLSALVGIAIRGGVAFDVDTLPRFAAYAIVCLFVAVASVKLPIVQGAMHTFSVRWTQAQGLKRDNTDAEVRVEDMALSGFSALQEAKPLGVGIGLGSQVAAALQERPQSEFRYGESPSDREMFELGSWLGLVFVSTRFVLSMAIVLFSFRGLQRGKMLAWFLMPQAFTLMYGAGLDQTTSQGFFVVVVGLWAAALHQEDF